MRLISVIVFLPLLFAGCHEHGEGHSHGAGEQDHEEHEHGGHGHGHHAEEEAAPTLDVTLYESGLELFMEYPAFVVGEESPLIAHLTDTRSQEGFEPITKGRLVAVLRMKDGSEELFIAEAPLRAGVFKPVVKPTKPGEATLVLMLEGEQATGTLRVEPVVVHPTLAAAKASAAADEAGEAETVPYLKEAQWKTEYATTVAARTALQGGVRANAEIKPVAGQAVELSAPVTGRVVVDGAVPHVGQAVQKGSLLLSIVPVGIAQSSDRSTLELERSRADSELGLAERNLTRATELFSAKAIPQKQLDAAQVAVDVAKARADAAQRQVESYNAAQGGGGRSASTFSVRSALDGVVAFANVTPGAVVNAGARLITVVNTERVWLTAGVYEADIGAVEAGTGAAFTVSGSDREFTIDDENGKRIAVGAIVDPATRTVPVIYEIDNKDGALKPGMFAKAVLYTGSTVAGVTIPQDAIVDDNGKPIVFVMDGGESFFKRRVKLGVRSGGLVQVLEGVADGERVVSRGAYELKLATASGNIPAHGHQH